MLWKSSVLSCALMGAVIISPLTQAFAQAAGPEAKLPLIIDDVESYGSRVVISLPGAVFQTGKDGTKNPKTLQMTLDYFKSSWKDGVGGSAGGFNQGSHSGKVTKHADKGMTVHVDMNVGSDRWVKGDPEAKYVLKFTKFGGAEVAGTFTGTFQGQKVSGNFTGKAELPGFNPELVIDGALNLNLNMGTRIQNWNAAKWKPYGMPSGVNMADYDHLEITVETDNPRHDAWLDMGMMEEDGSWYIVRDAIPLSAKKRTVHIPLKAARHAEWIFNSTGTGGGSEGNFDENSFLNLDTVVRLAFGTVNGHGVGQVNARLSGMKLVKLKQKKDSLKHEVVVNGKGFKFNDQAEIPVGIFGFHIAGGKPKDVAELRPGSIRWIQAMGWGGSYVIPPNPEIGLDIAVASQYDRKQQLPQANHKAKGDWREISANVGKAIGNASKPHGDKVMIEWWNEPYLDLGKMLERSMSKMTPPAGTKAGDPVGGIYGNMIWAPEDKLWFYRWYDKKPKNLPKGNGKLVPIDPHRFSYWSGPQISEFYNQTYMIVAENAKKINPKVQMIWSLGFRWQEDDWITWKLVHKPYIDKAIKYVDGVGEHHYQGYTDGMVGAYEVLATYGRVRHNKELYSVNTETNDLWDAPARGNAAAAGQKGGFVARKRLVYNLRDIMGVLKWSPDKLKARAIHALWAGQSDQRRKFGDALPIDRNLDAKATGVSYVSSATYLDGKDKKTIKAGPGKVLAVIKVAAKNKDPKRGKTVSFSDSKITIKTNGATKSYPMKVADTNKTHKKRGKYFSLAKGQSATVQAIYEIDRPAKDAVVEMVKPGRGFYKIHLSGPFAPFKVDPWRAMGINKGEYLALKFLADLRGQMMKTSVSNNEGEIHPNIWAVSSIDTKTQSLVTVVYNESWEEREVTLKLNAPAGSSITGGSMALLIHDEAGMVDLTEESIKVSGTDAEVTVKLKPAHAVKVALKLDKMPKPAIVQATQYHAGDKNDPDGGIIKEMAPGETLALPVTIPSGEVSKASAARIRLVVELVAKGDGYVVLGDQKIMIPASHTPNNGPYVRDIEVDPKLLSGLKALKFEAAPGEQGNGFRLCAASVILETESTK